MASIFAMSLTAQCEFYFKNAAKTEQYGYWIPACAGMTAMLERMDIWVNLHKKKKPPL
jgi:hypothetical protein